MIISVADPDHFDTVPTLRTKIEKNFPFIKKIKVDFSKHYKNCKSYPSNSLHEISVRSFADFWYIYTKK